MTETKQLPALAITAMQLLETKHRENVQLIANQTLEAMGLQGQWQVNFSEGVAFREVLDIQPEEVAA